MGYYRYSRWSHRTNTPSKYRNLVGLFGDAVEDIKQAFFALNGTALDATFIRYGRKHGSSAANYARNTFPKWKNGTTTLSGQTMERLLELIPPYLSSEQRRNLLLKVLEKNKPRRPRAQLNVHINPKAPAEKLAALQEMLASLQKADSLAYLPESVMQAASWLYGDDITVARAIIAEAANKENNIILASVTRDIALLTEQIQTGQITSASYSARMPAGQVSVSVSEPSKCFVATVCFGRESHEVTVLRRWRDSYLAHSHLGRQFIGWYYRHGEEISLIIGRSPPLRTVARSGLMLLVAFANKREI